MKKERLVVLIGTLVAIIFFYLGFNAWLKNKEEKITPPPVVIKPQPKEIPKQVEPTPPAEKPKEEKSTEQKVKVEEKKELPKEEKKAEKFIKERIKEEKEPQKKEEKVEKAVEEKIKEEKRQEKTTKVKSKTYIVQVGAFSSMENAQKALRKAKSLGYKGVIVEEGGLYKVRLKVITADINKDLGKLKSHFGSVLVKR
ncbi:SPOR domain-containing protein [Hydrogenobacter hydrogenophilus]|uniref:DedD protein n=1 Tax=Hydrogenobacter hydrogenophilus TaxID=35835 RepID=A0A285NZQ7_9AQUI|nr:SPOR domain-containing protein [Hydrogenobacter hydrogenophilus]SNZ14939.1 DedD protein [Hydrogenobacter hydrogenophilus]